MPFLDSHQTRYFVFENLQAAGLVHGVFTRLGGVSPAPWDSMNTGSKVGDTPARVADNLFLAARVLGRDPEGLISVRQVHGSSVYHVNRPPSETILREQLEAFAANSEIPHPETFPEADGIITRNPQATLFMRFADCVPVLIFDPVHRAVGISHAGWRGTVRRVAEETVRAMQETFDSVPADLIAGVGPSICADHYEVGAEVAEAAEKAFGNRVSEVLQSKDGKYRFDLWEANRLTLEEAGVTKIEVSGECTVSQPDLWYSHRGEQGRTGRFVAMAGLEES